MQKRKPAPTPEAIKRWWQEEGRFIYDADQDDEAPQESDKPRINQYTCQECGGVITTIDRAVGVTPFMLLCRATSGCQGSMHSSMYRVDQDLVPDYEWYKPKKLPRDPEMRDYIKRGGLEIRRIMEKADG